MRFFKKKLFWFIILSTIISISISFLQFKGVFENYDLDMFDRYTNWMRQDARPFPAIKLILIDNYALDTCGDSLGRWPWPRRCYNNAIDFVNRGNPLSIYFDMFFFSKEQDEQSTQLFADAISYAGNVHAGMQFFLDENQHGQAEIPAFVVGNFSIHVINNGHLHLPQYNNFMLPREELVKTLKSMPVYAIDADRDGVFRRAPFIFFYGGHYYPSLTLSALLDITGQKTVTISRGNVLSVGQYRVPLSENGEVLLNWYPCGFVPLSITGIFQSYNELQEGTVSKLTVNPDEFRDSVVLLGASATGTHDLKPTPINSLLPGPEIHATLLSNILKGDMVIWASRWLVIFCCIVLVFIIIFSMLYSKGFLVRYSTGILVMVGFILMSVGLYNEWGFFLPVFAVLIGCLSAYIAAMAYLTFTETREKQKIKKSFSKYLAPAILNEVLRKHDELTPEVGHKVTATILFTDIRSFTTISENFSVERVVNLLNEYFEGMLSVIYKYNGTVDKMIGDAIMAFWNAPLPMKDHALLAVQSALKMQTILIKMNEIWKPQGYPTIHMGVGINTGEVIVGNIGSKERLDYTAIGDNVNLASRLEGLCKKYHADIVISEPTYDLVKATIPCRILDKVQVKGKNKPVCIYEPMADSEVDRIKKWEKFYSVYIRRDWQAALKLASDFLTQYPEDYLAQYYLDLIKQFVVTPPPEAWDGVSIMDSK